jgi:tRNA threonylcarbamoyladenosine biosynthesis protein TsaB
VLTLALDTSSESGSVAVLREERLIGVLSTTAEETYSSRIFRQLEFLLAELSLSLDRFDLLAANAGPGSFTGLRVALTMGKAWAEVHGKPIAAVSGLEAVAAQYLGAAERVISVLDARRGQLYTGLYRRASGSSEAVGLVAEGEAVVITPQEFMAWLAEWPGCSEAIIATPSATWLASLLAAENGAAAWHPPIQQVSGVLAPTLGALGRARFLRGETVNALQLEANYVRRSDAEMNWKGR